MTRSFRRLSPLVVLAAACAWGHAAEEAVKGQRVFTTGHSFHYFIPGILAEIAAHAQIEGHQQTGLQAIGGSRVIQHWDAPDDKNKVKPALKSGEVDVLTMSPIYLPDEGIEKLAALGFEHNPKIRVTVQEFWLPFEDQEAWNPQKRPKEIDRDAMTVEQLREKHAAYFQSMDEHVAELNQKFGATVLYVVPVGQAVIALREKVIAGEAPGVAKQSELFTDVLGHVNAPIQVLNAYCHYAVIYQRSPEGLGVPKALAGRPKGEELNALLQKLAWDAVVAHPLSGVKK